MWIAFNKNTGVIERQLNYGPKARQGVVGSFSIFCYFGDLDISNTTATITFKRPDNTNIDVNYVMDYVTRTENIFDRNNVSSIDADTYPFVNGFGYEGFVFTPQDPAILSMAGQYKAAVRIYRENDILVQGEIVFNVENAVFNEQVSISATDYTEIMHRLFGKANSDVITPYYSVESTYEVGDLVMYNDSLYRCVTAVDVPGEFNSTYWAQTNVDQEIKSRIARAQLSGQIDFDRTPTEGSENGVESGGVYSWVLSQISTAIQSAGPEIIAQAKTQILDAAYPIGSIYMSLDPTDPATLFGGTWERIKHTFLLGAGDSTDTAGETGGERTHTLSIAEMPLHNHPATLNFVQGTTLYSVDLAADYAQGSGGTWKGVATGQDYNNLVINMGQTGGNQPHNNMPPYLAVYMWKRVADPVEE